MLTPTNRPRSGDTLDTKFGRGEDNTELLSRRIGKRVKPPAVASGGVAGVTRLTAGGIFQQNDGFTTTLNFNTYTVEPLHGGTLVDIAEGTFGDLTFGDGGYYQCLARIELAWPLLTAGRLVVGADYQDADPFPQWYLLPVPTGTNQRSLRQSFPWGPFHVEAGGFTHLDVSWPSLEPASLNAMALDVWRVG